MAAAAAVVGGSGAEGSKWAWGASPGVAVRVRVRKSQANHARNAPSATRTSHFPLSAFKKFKGMLCCARRSIPLHLKPTHNCGLCAQQRNTPHPQLNLHRHRLPLDRGRT
jgi:hypothetical protein